MRCVTGAAFTRVDADVILVLNIDMENSARIGCVLALLMCGVSFNTHASSEEMSFRLVQDCSNRHCESAILGEGGITSNTLEELKVFVRQNPEAKTVFFHSPGGNLAAGLKVGQFLRVSGLNTAVSDQMRCLSACAYAFLGGNRREVRPGGIIGVHRFYSSGTTDEDDVQIAVNILTEYVKEMGVSASLMSAAAQAGRDGMMALDVKASQELRVDNTLLNPVRWGLHPLDGVLLVSGSGLDAGSDRAATALIADGKSSIFVGMGVTYDNFGSTATRGRFTLGVCLEDECLHVKNGVDQERDDQFSMITFSVDKEQFYDFLSKHPNSRYISFIAKSAQEETMVFGDFETFKVLLQRTGSSENYIRVR